MATTRLMMIVARLLNYPLLSSYFHISCTSSLSEVCLILPTASIFRKRHAELARQQGHAAIKIDEADERKLIKLQAISRGRADRLKMQRKVG